MLRLRLYLFMVADHINLSNVQGFIAASDFFTLDVASKIGTVSGDGQTAAFIASCKKYSGILNIPGIAHPFEVSDLLLNTITKKFLAAIAEAGKIYNFINCLLYTSDAADEEDSV